MTNTYNFGVPRIAVWTSHILIGLFLAYVGFGMLQNKKFPLIIPVILIILGVLASLYHAHLWYYHVSKKDQDEKETFGVQRTKGYYDTMSQDKLSY